MPAIATVCIFESESSPGKTYETLQYVDGSTSCNCKGWTIKRRTVNGQRSCRHTRIIDCGLEEQHAKVIKRFAPVQPVAPKPVAIQVRTVTVEQPELEPRQRGRVFELD